MINHSELRSEIAEIKATLVSSVPHDIDTLSQLIQSRALPASDPLALS
ncbi:MAG: hypothetical protein ACNA7I_02840 [Candidatus Methanoperedens sp.]